MCVTLIIHVHVHIYEDNVHVHVHVLVQVYVHYSRLMQCLCDGANFARSLLVLFVLPHYNIHVSGIST